MLISSSDAMENWCFLPEDIVFTCILTRLPVKSIVRFKSVCKPWLELFSTPSFVKSHHAQFSSDPKNESLMILSCSDTSTEMNINYYTEKKLVTDHPDGPNYSYDGVHLVVGCCNGLICMVGPDGIGFVLWNPATRLSKFVPLPKVNFHNPENPNRLSLGFGYDAEGGDFKVVRVSRNNGAEVYSVGSNSWTRITLDSKFWCMSSECDLIVNGNPYWVARGDKRSIALLCFDSTKLVFKTVPLPAFFYWSSELGCLINPKTNHAPSHVIPPHAPPHVRTAHLNNLQYHAHLSLVRHAAVMLLSLSQSLAVHLL